jgi:hypothetical protein
MLRLSREGLLKIDMTSLAVLSIDDLLASLGLGEADRVDWYRERVTARTTTGDERTFCGVCWVIPSTSEASLGAAR